MSAELTTVKKILVAASQLDAEGDTFTAEDLIVRAWQQFPESFGLNGYREAHPDSNRVLSKLMGSVGLCSRGWLEQVSTKTYRMTPAGRKLVDGIKTESENDSAEPSAARTSSRPERSPVAPKDRAEPTPRPAPRAVEAQEAPVQRPAASAKPVSAPKATVTSVPARDGSRESAPAPLRAVPSPAPAAASGSNSNSAAVATRESVAPAIAPAAVAAPVAKPASAPKADAAPAASASGNEFEGIASLTRLATSVASQKFSRGGQVTFADACQFWAINSATRAPALAARMADIEALLKRAETHIVKTNSVIRVHERLDLTMTTVIGLQGLHRMLATKYTRELDAIRKANADD